MNNFEIIFKFLVIFCSFCSFCNSSYSSYSEYSGIISESFRCLLLTKIWSGRVNCPSGSENPCIISSIEFHEEMKNSGLSPQFKN